MINWFVCIILHWRHTCIRRQVEVKDGNDGDEDAREDDVEDVVQRLPLDDQVEGHVLILIVICVLPAWLVSDVPLAALWTNVHVWGILDQQSDTAAHNYNSAKSKRGPNKSANMEEHSCDYGSNI